MDRLRSLFRRGAPRPVAQPAARGYFGAQIYRQGVSFITELQSKDAEVRKDVAALRANARRLANDNPYMRRYLRTIGGQVVGPDGVVLQSQFQTRKGAIRSSWAEAVESAWAEWGKKGTCTVCGRYSWTDVQRLWVRTAALDGEVFVRVVRGARNPFGFALQLLDADLLDHTLHRPAGRGLNAVVMGVEVDAWGRPVAYHFTDPADTAVTYPRGRKIRIPASEILHGMDPERVNQTRGVPWTAPVMYLLSMLGSYWEAEVAAARHEAERVGFLKGTPDAEGNPTSAEGAEHVIPSTALQYIGLPAGVDVVTPDLVHPGAAFAEFSKAMLKGIASGLGISYSALASDLTEVSYSSIRQGAIEEREYYRELQRGLLIEGLADPVFGAWVEMAVLTGGLQVPANAGLAQVAARTWEPRGWDWVDPKNDTESKIAAIAAGLDTRTRVLAEKGQSFQDVVAKLAEEQQALADAGVTVTTQPAKTGPQAQGGANAA